MNPVILINPFEAPADEGEEFVARWHEAADYMRRQEGFISTRLHRSLDPRAKFRFVNVAVWESAEHFRQAVGTPEFRERAEGMPFPAHPALYESISE